MLLIPVKCGHRSLHWPVLSFYRQKNMRVAGGRIRQGCRWAQDGVVDVAQLTRFRRATRSCRSIAILDIRAAPMCRKTGWLTRYVFAWHIRTKAALWFVSRWNAITIRANVEHWNLGGMDDAGPRIKTHALPRWRNVTYKPTSNEGSTNPPHKTLARREHGSPAKEFAPFSRAVESKFSGL